jgi:hypothetical protein
MSVPAKNITPMKIVERQDETTVPVTLNIFDMTESSFKALLERRAKNRVTFLTIVKSALTENVDYCSLPVKGKKALPTLLKGGAEVVCLILGLTPRIAIAESNDKSLTMCCELYDENQQVVSVGYGARSYSLDASNGGLNKTTKMAVKSAYLDAVIRAGALSSLFTMDLEEQAETKPVTPETKPITQSVVPISSVQCKEIEDLITEHHVDKVRCLNWIIKLVQSKNNSTIAVLTQLPNTLFDEVLSKIPTFANTAN